MRWELYAVSSGFTQCKRQSADCSVFLELTSCRDNFHLTESTYKHTTAEHQSAQPKTGKPWKILTLLVNISCTIYILIKVNSEMIEVFDGRKGVAKFLVWGQWLYDTSSRYRCQQPSPGPLPQCWKLILPVEHLVSNTTSPTNVKYENKDHLPQLLLRAADQGRWAARE